MCICTTAFLSIHLLIDIWTDPITSMEIETVIRNLTANKWIRKLWYIYTMEYYSAIKKNTFELVLMSWMKLEPIIQSEVTQKEKHQYSILMHMYGI